MVFEDRGRVYVQDYLKNEVDRFAPATLLLKIRQYIIDLYQTQLPLKPLERDICISRQTMRKEIEFQTFFLPKKPKLNENKPVDINYLSYSNVFSIDKNKNNKLRMLHFIVKMLTASFFFNFREVLLLYSNFMSTSLGVYFY